MRVLGLKGRPSPELLVLQAMGQNLLQSESAAVKRFTQDVLNRMEKPVLVCDCQGRCVFQSEIPGVLSQREENMALAGLDLGGAELRRLLDMGIPVLQFRDELIVSANHRMPVLLDIYPVPGHQGQRLGSYVVMTDLTEDHAAATWRKQVSFALDAVLSGVIGFGPDNRVTFCNRPARDLLGLMDAKVEGKTLSDLMEALGEGSRALLGALVADGEQGTREFDLSGQDGGRQFAVNVSTLPGEAGRVIVFHETTLFNEAQHQVQECEKLAAIGELAAGTAHEIRNPLTTIRGFVQILQQKAKNAGFEDITRYSDIIISEIDRVNVIIAEFLLLSKPTAASRQEIDINEIVKQVFPFVLNESLRLDFIAEMELTDDLPHVVADAEHLKQVLLNLVNNAFQAISAEGRIKIKTFIEEGGRVCLAVEDNGVGIPADVQDRLFKPFFSTKQEGTGLGLAISRRIVQDHGGEIRVKSSEGVGSTFFICLPPVI